MGVTHHATFTSQTTACISPPQLIFLQICSVSASPFCNRHWLMSTVMALPLSILFSLHMNTRTKVALGGLFLTGFIIVLFAILRLVYTIPSDEHVNPKWLEIWSSTEACIAVSVSCAPPFRKYFISRARTASTQRHSTSSQSAAGPSNSLPVRPEELDVEEK